jgi:hypothetical protein
VQAASVLLVWGGVPALQQPPQQQHMTRLWLGGLGYWGRSSSNSSSSKPNSNSSSSASCCQRWLQLEGCRVMLLLLQLPLLQQQVLVQGLAPAPAQLAAAVMLHWAGWRHCWGSMVLAATQRQQQRTQQIPLPLQLALPKWATQLRRLA